MLALFPSKRYRLGPVATLGFTALDCGDSCFDVGIAPRIARTASEKRNSSLEAVPRQAESARRPGRVQMPGRKRAGSRRAHLGPPFAQCHRYITFHERSRRHGGARAPQRTRTTPKGPRKQSQPCILTSRSLRMVNNVELSFDNVTLRRTCRDPQAATQAYGPTVAAALRARLADFDAALTFADLPDAGTYNTLSQELTFDLHANWVLVCSVAGRNKNGQMDFTHVYRLKLRRIVQQ